MLKYVAESESNTVKVGGSVGCKVLVYLESISQNYMQKLAQIIVETQHAVI